MEIINHNCSAHTNQTQAPGSKQQSPGILEALFRTETKQLAVRSPPLSEDIALELQCDTGGEANNDSAVGHEQQCTNFTTVQITDALFHTAMLEDQDEHHYSLKFPEFGQSCPEREGVSNYEEPPTSINSPDHNPPKNVASIGLAEVITCKICFIQFSSGESLTSHYEDKHSIKQECAELTLPTFCSTSKNKSLELDAIHENIKRNKRPSINAVLETSYFVCDICQHKSKTKRLLKDHIFAKHNPHRIPYSCEKCSFTCLKQSTLSLHKRRHGEELKFACDQCGKLFLTMSILKRHASTHNKTRSFLCPVSNCSMSFNIKGRLSDHIRRVHKRKALKPNRDSSVFPAISSKRKTNLAETVSPQQPTVISHEILYEEKQSFEKKNLNPAESCTNSHILLPEDHFEDASSSNNSKKSSSERTSPTEHSRDVYVVLYRDVLKQDFQRASQITKDANQSQAHKMLKKVSDNCEYNKSVLGSTSRVKNRSMYNVCDSKEILVSPCGESKTICDPNTCTCNDATQNTVVGGRDQQNYEVQGRLQGSGETTQRIRNSTADNKGRGNFICHWANCGRQFRDGYNLRMHVSTHTGEMQRACTLCRYRCVQKSALDAHMKTHFRGEKCNIVVNV